MSETVLKVSAVSKTFLTAHGPQVALKDVSLDVHEGEIICITGPSGSGKSTLLRTINALETIDSGTIEVCGDRYDDRRVKAHQIRRHTAMIFQRFELFAHYTVLGNVALALERVRGYSKRKAEQAALSLLERVGLSEHTHKYPGSLSGGQQQRVAIARALSMEPRILLCDEPTSALDPELVHEVTELLSEIAKNKITMMIVTHQLSFARRISTRCVFLDRGELLETQDTTAFFESPKSEHLKSFLSRVGAAY